MNGPTLLPEHTATDYQVWVSTPANGPIYAYRTGLINSVATRWAAAWNEKRPADVPEEAEFVVVIACTTYTVAQRGA